MLFLFTNSSGPTVKRKNLFRFAYENGQNNYVSLIRIRIYKNNFSLGKFITFNEQK